MKYSIIMLAVLAGCGTSQRRLDVIHEAKLVLRHSTTDQDWVERRAKLESHIQAEDPDAQ